MSDIIQNTINDVLQDGARATKFRCALTLPPVFGSSDRDLDILCKTTLLPTHTNEPIVISYKGRKIPIPGQDTFNQSIDLTFYMDEAHAYRQVFENWMIAMSYLNYQETNASSTDSLISQQSGDLLSGKTSITLTQLDFDGVKDKAAYTFYHVFPKSISQIEYNAESTGALLEFTVSFSYTYYEAMGTSSSMNSNDIANKLLGAVQDNINKIVNSAMGYLPSFDSGTLGSIESSIQDAGASIQTGIDDFLVGSK